jgi:altronate hydrolase/altronate dehydratase small subunit
MTGQPHAIVLHADDDVAVLITPLEAGMPAVVEGAGQRLSLTVAQSLPLGHKIALRDLPAGHHVRKHGEVIGALTRAVAAGEHVHVHNLASLRAGG